MSYSLPLFPLQTVLFPGGRLPLKIFEQRYLQLMKGCVARNSSFGICALRAGQEVGEPATPFEVGTQARIIHWDMPQPGIFHVLVEGIERYVARKWRPQHDGLIVADVDDVAPESPVTVTDDLRLAVDVLKQIVEDAGEKHFGPERHFDDAVWVGFRLAEVLPFKLSIKQNLLEMNDSLMRLRILAEFLRHQGRS
ncbi:MAG TPA: LON peptidase substrate-binding domain-containing protein [Thiobacillaceae bacterium]|nr:LON peptidase substrate-binding domain-containing protein [Thiobacillaceae bacterium]